MQSEVEMTDQTQPRPWWRLFRVRLSLRALMFIVMLIAIWFGRYAISVRIQRDAVAAITQAGGSVTYDWEWGTSFNPDIIDPNEKPRAPKWLANLIGVDYVANVVSVNLSTPSAKDANKADDATLAHVGRLGRLENLNLAGTAVTDAGMAHLKGLTSLRDLNLWNIQVGGAGLAHLKGLTNLRMLPLVGTRVTDDGVLELKRALPWLQILREEDVDFQKNIRFATSSLNFAQSQPIRLAWLLLVHRAKLMANRRDNTELIATLNALCDLEAIDKDRLRKLARARAECLDILEPDYSPGLSDSERQALRQRCTDRWFGALSRAIEQGFNDVSQLEDDLWDAGVLENLRNHPEFPKLVEKMNVNRSGRGSFKTDTSTR
jgi:hypothetical protein